MKNVNGGSPLLTPDDHALWVDTTYNLHNQIHREDMDGNQPRRTNKLEAELIAETLEQIERQSAAQGYPGQTSAKSAWCLSMLINAEKFALLFAAAHRVPMVDLNVSMLKSIP